MKYIIMCGGKYEIWATPRQLCRIHEESIIQRTIRLLVNASVSKNDIFVSTNIPVIRDYCNAENINLFWMDTNNWIVHRPGSSSGYWCDGFYPLDDPACYLMGDVIFSQKAINTIVETATDDIEFFASAPPFFADYTKRWAEPFAFKVVNQNHLKEAQSKTRELCNRHAFRRNAIAWEFWQVVKGTPINHIDYTNYTVINDYTCDIDVPADIEKFRNIKLD